MSKVSEKLVESSSYNLLGVYLAFALGILNTFFIARLLIPEAWAIIILTINFIYICVFICNLFPPNAQDSIKYYVPHLISEGTNENNGKKKDFILHVFKIRFLSSCGVYSSYILIAFLANFQREILQIVLIMSPIVLIDILNNLNKSILLAFQNFKKVFIVHIIYPLTTTIGLFLMYTYPPNNRLESVAYIYLFSSIIACICSVILVIPLLFLRNRNIRTSPQYKHDFLDVHKKYGVYLTIADVFTQLSFLIVYFLFLNFDLLIFITWLTICEISVLSALYFSSSNPSAYISIFSEINIQKDPGTFKANFYKLNKFLLLFVCIIVGIMIFFIELYVIIIYSHVYIIILLMIQIFLFTTFSRIIIRNLFILTQSTNNTRLNAIISFIQMVLNVGSAIFALVFFSFRALIIGFIINSYIMTFIAVYIVNKNLDIKLKSIMFFKPILVFILSFLIVLPLTLFMNFAIIPGFYLLNIFFNSLLRFAIFVIVFYLIFYFTRVLTKEEFNQLVEIIPILSSKNKLIRGIVKIIEKFLPSEKLEK